MAVDKLTNSQIKGMKIEPGKKSKQLADGGGLSVLARKTPAGSISKSFIFRGTRKGQGQLQPEHLGSYPRMTLTMARAERDRLNALLKGAGISPREDRKKRKSTDTKPRTISRLLNEYFKIKIEPWREGRDNGEKWQERIKKGKNQLKRIHASPFGEMLVKDVESDHISPWLDAIFDESLSSGYEIKRILRAVFRMAVSKKWIKRDDNPASDEVFEDLLAERFYVPKPHDAIDYLLAPRFVAEIKAYKNRGLGMAEVPLATAPALLWLIYTGVRTKDVRYARWGQIRRNQRLWEVPAEIRKTGHLKHGAIRAIPISDAMLKVLNKQKERYRGEPPADDLIFPGDSAFGGLARGSINGFIKTLLKSLNWGIEVKVTAHGFRATLKQWARAQEPRYLPIYIERQFDHVVRGLEVAAELMSDGVSGYDDHNRPGMTDPTIEGPGRRRDMTEKYGEYLESYKEAPEIADTNIAIAPTHQAESITP
jgi:integrase